MEEQKLLKKKMKAISEHNKSMHISCCNELAEFFKQHDKFEQAIEEYKEMALLYEEMGKHIDYAIAHRMIGEIYSAELNEFKAALHHEKIYLNTAKTLSNSLEIQRALATIGRTFLLAASEDPDNVDKKQLENASKAFFKSLQVCESLKNISKKEQADMKARLFLNIGLTKENKGCYDEAVEYIEKSITLCKSNDMFGQLHQSYTNLALLYMRKKNYFKSLQSIDLAFDIAKRLSDKTNLMCSTLMVKSDILIKVNDFNAAKQSLLKAYKLKTSNKEDFITIERSLKIVSAMCNTENSLLITPSDDFENRKNLYEKMGDGACELGIYEKAIDYYKKMLECAKKLELTPKELSPVYISLALTYQDNKEFDLALEYFQKDYELCKNNPEEAYVSLMHIIDAMIQLKKPFDDIENIFKQAKHEAMKSSKESLQKNIFNKMIMFYTEHDRQFMVESLEKERETLKLSSIESDSDNDNCNAIESIGANINISDISDLSDESDIETPQKERITRKRSHLLKIKKNNKGESQLHLACIAGNLALVTKLLDQGHVVNIRDHAGWLPIHEACINGFEEIVEILTEKGAWINDRGGLQCDGITPLHDAASNGYLSIIELLLDKGASAVSKTNYGDTPLDTLIKWHSKAVLDADIEAHYQFVYKRLKTAMDKAGKSLNNTESEESSKEILEASNSKASPKKDVCKYANNAENIEDNIFPDKYSSSDSDEPHSTKSNVKCETQHARKEYQQVMDDLRKRGRNILQNKTHENLTKRPALVDENDVGDDWLEDDIGSRFVKRRKTLMKNTEKIFTQSYRSSNNTEKSYEDNHKSPMKTKRRSNEMCTSTTGSINNEIVEIAYNEEQEHVISEYSPVVSDAESVEILDNSLYLDVANKKTAFPKRKKQRSLLDIGFSRDHNSIPSRSSNISTLRKSDEFNTSFQSNMSTCSQRSGSTAYSSNLLSINVKIENTLWKVPIPGEKSNILTIKWLAKEAAERYYSKEGIKPTLQLETPEGAILTDNDPIILVLSYDQLISKVISWNLPSLTERYTDACKVANVGEDSYLLAVLDACQATQSLSLADLSLTTEKSIPVLRALNHQHTLEELNLSGNHLTDENMKVLCESFRTMTRLQSLNLSSNLLTAESFEFLSNILENTKILSELEHLDISYNSLGEGCLKHLIDICIKLPLKILNLSYCDLTFNRIQDRRYELNPIWFEFIETIHLEGNIIDRSNMKKILSTLNPNTLKYINLSGAVNEKGGIVNELIDYLENNTCENLEVINLARCNINDSDVLNLLRVIQTYTKLNTLNVSYNDNLTFLSLTLLLKHDSSFINLIITGCDNIAVNIESISSCIILKSSKLSSIKITLPSERCLQTLTDLWKTCWGAHSSIKKGILGYYEFSVINL